MDYKKLLEVIALQEEYFKKITNNKETLPIDYYYINDVDKKKELLEEALRTNKRLEELEYMQRLHFIKIQTKLEEEIEETRSRLNKR
jgi:hypothetical protein